MLRLQEIVGQPFSWYDRAFALPPGARNDALIAAMNDALLQLNFQGLLSLPRHTLLQPASSCPASWPL